MLETHSRSRHLVALLCALSIAIIALGAAIPVLQPADLSVLNRIHAVATPGLTTLARVASRIGAPSTLWLAMILLGAILWFRRHRRAAITLLATMSLAGLLENLIKLIVRRPRPTIPWAFVHENTYSFPSGHATLAAALYGLVALYALGRPSLQRATLIALSLLLTVTIGISRLYLGAHHPTDVLAGYLTGATCLLAVQTLQNRPPG